MFAHVDEISGAKRKQSLKEGQQQAKLSRRLVQLDGYVPIEIDWDAARRGAFDKNEVFDLFKELGFHGFAAKVRAMEVPSTETVVRPPEDWQAEYRTVDTPEGLATLVEELSRQSQFSFDTETTHIWPTWADLVGLSFAWQEGEGWYVPVCGPAGEQCLDRQMVLEALRPVLEDPRIKKVGQNLKYDLIVLRTAGIHVQGVAFDTMVASYLLDAGERNHNLDELALRFLNHENIKIGSLIGSGRDQLRMDEVSIARVAEYAGEDADVALRLTPILQRKLEGAELDGLNESLELPLIDVLVEMESNGIRVDVQRLAELSEQFGRQLQLVETQIYDMAGKPFNIGSPKQLQELLFTQFKLPVIKRSKNGPSTDVDVLEELGRVHPLPAKIIEYRQFAKLKNTYVDALPAMINPRTGRVHASFNQVVAATGRLSSHDPNLQNIPIRSEEGRAIRSAFLPGQDDWLLLAADYSQIELRVLAHFCQDPTLLEAFARDEDIHARVASEVHGVPLDAVTAEMRRQAKAVNFGIIYGQSAFGLARQLGIDQKDGEQFIDAYFARYSRVEEFLNGVLAQCQANGYVSTIRGRRRSIQGIRPGVRRQRNPPERTAINTVIQGSAADLIKEAMLAVHRRLKQEKRSARLLLQVHDELVLEVPTDEADALSRLVTEEMSQVLPLRVPIRVDVKTGRTWADV
jgi:DNA polymerase-1